MESEKEGHFKTYQEYNLILRAWFVSFGVAAPIIFLTNEDLYQKIIKLKDIWPCILYLFLIGLFLQVIIAFVNKTMNWHIYYGMEEKGHKNSCWYKASKWISNKYIIDFTIDLLTIMAFSWATVRLVFSLTQID